MRPGITRNPKHFLDGTSLGYEHMKQGKYISGDERGGFKVAKVNFFLPDGRLSLFLEGKEDWLEEGILVPSKKIREEQVLPQPKREVHNKIMCHHLEEFRRRRVTTVMYQCKHGGVVQPYPHQILWCPTLPLQSHMHTYLNLNKVGPSLEDTLRKTCQISQPSKPMQTKWVKEMQKLL
jgi:hypothetical protein